jgi:chromosome segregation ATPase
MSSLSEEIHTLQQILVGLSAKAEDLRPVLAVGSRSYIDQLVSDIQQTRNRLTKIPTPGSLTYAKDKLTSYRAEYEEFILEREDPGHLARRDLLDIQSQLQKEQEQVASLRKELSEANKQISTAKQEKANVQNKLEHQVKEFDKYKQQAVTARQELTKQISNLQREIGEVKSKFRGLEQQEPSISKRELKNRVLKNRVKAADRAIADYRRDVKLLTHQSSNLKGQLAIANAATDSSQELLNQSHEAQKFLEQELAELKDRTQKLGTNTTQKKGVQVKVEYSLPSTLVQRRLSISPEKFRSEPQILREFNNEKFQEVRDLQEKFKTAQKELEDTEYQLQLKSGDAKRFQTACSSLQKDAAEFNSIKSALQKEIKDLQDKLADEEKNVTSLTTRKHEMFQESEESKQKLEAALYEKRKLAEENTGIKRKWKEVANTMTSFAETWKEPEGDEERMTAPQHLSRANVAVVAARYQQNLSNSWFAGDSSPRTPQREDRGRSTTSRCSVVDESYPEPEMPTALLKPKEDSKIPGYVVVKEVSHDLSTWLIYSWS